jgi:hypothetical protein
MQFSCGTTGLRGTCFEEVGFTRVLPKEWKSIAIRTFIDRS